MREGRLTPKDFFKDIVSSIKMNRGRGMLSALMTVWGVFIFIAVVGTSNGINRGNRSNYDYLLEYGMITVIPGEVSIPHKGFVKGRRISLTRNDAEELQRLFSERSEYIYPRQQFFTECGSLTGSIGVSVSDFRGELNEKYLKIIEGRGFTRFELNGRNRICLIPESVAVQLFENPGNAVGNTLKIRNLPYTILGVYRVIHNVGTKCIFVPFETAMSMQGTDETLSSIDIKFISGAAASDDYRLKRDLESWLCSKKGVDPDDVSALRFVERIDFIHAQEKLLDSIQWFTEILGLLSLLMSILGVSSIVNLSVKERTKEIAVRLVCGSSKSSIFRLVIGEAVMTMLLFGFVGMLLGSAALEGANIIVDRINVDAKWVFIGDLTVSWQLILSATVLIIICGLVAGYSPARKAMSIRINEAMSSE